MRQFKLELTENKNAWVMKYQMPNATSKEEEAYATHDDKATVVMLTKILKVLGLDRRFRIVTAEEYASRRAVNA